MRAKTIYLKDYSPSAFLIDEVRLRFELGEDVTVVHSQLTMRRNSQAKSNRDALVLDGRELELEGVAIDGEPLEANRYEVDEESLTIADTPDRFELGVVTRIKPQDNTSLEGLYKSSGNFCTQCEAQGFRKITYFLDRPDVMARYTTTVVADKDRYPVLLSNGNPVAREDLDGSRHTATWRDPYPKPSYLFALVAGDLVCKEDHYKTRSGRDVALRFYVQAHNADKTAHAMAALKKAMRWDEERFGLEYDLDIYMIVAVDDFNMGAMENKGLNIFNSKYVLAKPETATDSDYQGIEGVIAHEYFHNWTGNRVTCRDWFQLSLKEGLTVFRDQEFTADVTSPAVKRIDDVRTLRTLQFAEDAGPMAHPVRPASYIEINNFYTVTVYEKGAEVVRMYQTLLGRDGFRKGMDLYFERHDGQAVTTDDFAAAMAHANGADLTQFKRWYEQAGTPELRGSGEWDAGAQTYRLRITQHNPPTPGQDKKAPLQIPCAAALLGASGENLPLQLAGENEPQGIERVLDVNKAEQEFSFINVTEKPVPSLLRGFSAPVKLDYGYTDEELAFLLAHDSDPFNRWDAGQRLAIKIMLDMIEDHRAGKVLHVDDAFVTAIGNTLSATDLGQALVAAAVTLPSENYLAELMEEVDVDAIHAVREFMQQQLARGLEADMLRIYESSAASGPYVYNAAEAGRRRLRNLCLRYLTSMSRDEYYRLAMAQFEGADDMTDSLGALTALNDTDAPQREQVLQVFHDKWQSDTLVMDKWFSMQAMSRRSDTLQTVQRLMEHPLFSIENPNKVRALVGAFAHGNPVNFHQASGDGYAFIADRVLQLDPLNSQVAARLVKSFSRWKNYDEKRRGLMKHELERVVQTNGISKDVYEIVSKSLA